MSTLSGDFDVFRTHVTPLDSKRSGSHRSHVTLTHQVSDRWDLFHISIWEGAHRQHLERKGSDQQKIMKSRQMIFFQDQRSLPIFVTQKLWCSSTLFLFKVCWLVRSYSNLLRTIQIRACQEGVARIQTWNLAVGSVNINPALQSKGSLIKDQWFKQQIIYLYPRRWLFCSKWVFVSALRQTNPHITPVRKETHHVHSILQFLTEAAPIPKLVWCSCNELLPSRVAKQYVGHQTAKVSLSARSSCSTTTDAALLGCVWPSPACSYI